MEQVYTQSTAQVLQQLGTSAQGLSTPQAEERLGQYGPNRLRGAPKPTLAQRFVQQLKDPMLLILLAAAVVSGITNFVAGENFAEAAIILVVVLLNAILGVVQESKAEAAIEALQTMTGRHLQGDAGRTSDHPAQRRAGARGCGGTGSGGQRPGGRTPAGECQPQDRGGRPDGGECAGHQAGKTAVIAARPDRSATGRICAIWAPRWSTAGAGR